MRVVRSEDHRQHFPVGELYNGELVRLFECPERWDHVVEALVDAGLSDNTEPTPIDIVLLEQVHHAGFVGFLRTAWADWTAAGISGEMIPTCFPGRRMGGRIPTHIDGRLGWGA